MRGYSDGELAAPLPHPSTCFTPETQYSAPFFPFRISSSLRAAYERGFETFALADCLAERTMECLDAFPY